MALTILIFMAQLGDCMLGPTLRFLQKRGTQADAACFKMPLGGLRRGQCFSQNMLTFITRSINDALCSGFGCQQTFKVIFHF